MGNVTSIANMACVLYKRYQCFDYDNASMYNFV